MAYIKCFDNEELSELKTKRVVRGGVVKKKKIAPKGYKIDADGKMVKIKTAEKINRKKGAKRASRTKASHSGIQKQANRKRKKSMKKGKNLGLHNSTERYYEPFFEETKRLQNEQEEVHITF